MDNQTMLKETRRSVQTFVRVLFSSRSQLLCLPLLSLGVEDFHSVILGLGLHAVLKHVQFIFTFPKRHQVWKVRNGAHNKDLIHLNLKSKRLSRTVYPLFYLGILRHTSHIILLSCCLNSVNRCHLHFFALKLSTLWFYLIVCTRLVLGLSSLHTFRRKFSDLKLLSSFNLQPFRFNLAGLLALYQRHHNINRDLTFIIQLLIDLLPLQDMLPRFLLIQQHVYLSLLISVLRLLSLYLVKQLPLPLL